MASKANQEAMHEADAHNVASQTDAVPEEGGHAHSHAAHLHESGSEKIKPAGNNHQNANPGGLKQPPAEISRAGKQHRD